MLFEKEHGVSAILQGLQIFHFATCDVWKTAPALALLHSTASRLRAASALLGFHTSAAQNTPPCPQALPFSRAWRFYFVRKRGEGCRPEALREARGRGARAGARRGQPRRPGSFAALRRARPRPRGSHVVRRVRRPLAPVERPLADR